MKRYERVCLPAPSFTSVGRRNLPTTASRGSDTALHESSEMLADSFSISPASSPGSRRRRRRRHGGARARECLSVFVCECVCVCGGGERVSGGGGGARWSAPAEVRRRFSPQSRTEGKSVNGERERKRCPLGCSSAHSLLQPVRVHSLRLRLRARTSCIHTDVTMVKLRIFFFLSLPPSYIMPKLMCSYVNAF